MYNILAWGRTLLPRFFDLALPAASHRSGIGLSYNRKNHFRSIQEQYGSGFTREDLGEVGHQ